MFTELFFSANTANVIIAWTGLVGVLIPVFTFIYKCFIKPRIDFKKNTIKSIKDINDKITTFDTNLSNCLKSATQENTALKEDIDHDLEIMRKDFEHLQELVEKLSTKSENDKNQILEILLKYFSDRN